VQARLYDVVVVSPERTSVPDTALVPDQPPAAVQLVVPVDDQVNVDDPPANTLSGLAENVTVGAGGGGALTVIVTEVSAEPPGPVQARLYDAVVVSSERTSVPDRALVPDQPPVAVQVVVFMDDQVNVDDPPVETLSGLADNVTVGAGGGEPGAWNATSCMTQAPLGEIGAVAL
jgi:hypothetical protein